MEVLSWSFHKCFAPFNMLTVEGCSETTLFSEWSNQLFEGPSFRKYIAYEDLLLFENIWNLMDVSQMQKKTKKMFFVFKIIAF